MKKDIHPSFFQTSVTCACGNVFLIGTTLEHAFRVEACYRCHPFYTGKQKLVDTAGRVDRFRQRAQAAQRITEEKGKHRTGRVSEDVPTEKAAVVKRSAVVAAKGASAKQPAKPKKSLPSAKAKASPRVKKTPLPRKASVAPAKSASTSPKKTKK